MGNCSQRKEHSIDTRNSIIQAVQNLMHYKKIQEVKIREICQEAHVSIGTFYLYFPCKEAVLLYIYRDVDRELEKIPLKGTPLEDIVSVMNGFLRMVKPDSLDVTKQIYIGHLIYFDSYFFNEDRYLFRILKEKVSQYLDEHDYSKDAGKMVWRLLNYGRGSIYNLCISFSPVLQDWYDTELLHIMKYFQFLCTEEL